MKSHERAAWERWIRKRGMVERVGRGDSISVGHDLQASTDPGDVTSAAHGLPKDALRRILPPISGTNARMSGEDVLAVQVTSWLASATLSGKITAVWFHPANEVGGGTRHAVIRYSLARRMGLIPGIPDFIFLWSSGSGMIELKLPQRRSALSSAQKDVAAWSACSGVRWAVCCSLDEVRAVLEEWGVVRQSQHTLP